MPNEEEVGAGSVPPSAGEGGAGAVDAEGSGAEDDGGSESSSGSSE